MADAVRTIGLWPSFRSRAPLECSLSLRAKKPADNGRQTVCRSLGGKEPSSVPTHSDFAGILQVNSRTNISNPLSRVDFACFQNVFASLIDLAALDLELREPFVNVQVGIFEVMVDAFRNDV